MPYYDSIIDENHKSDLTEVEMSDRVKDKAKTLTISTLVKKDANSN